MDRFEFRAWHWADKKMYRVIGMTLNSWLLQGKSVPMPPGAIEINQATGLLDKNGKKIFEGDITKDSTGLCLVGWNKDLASFCLRRKGWAFQHFFGEAVDPTDVEVIGNIYENSELLEEKSER